MKYRFEDIITEYIKDKKISAETFGKMLKVKPEEVKKWLIGMNLPDWKKRNEILRTIQCPVDVEDRDGFKFKCIKKEVKYTLDNKMEYYRSPKWQEVCEKRKKIDKNRCILCGEDKDLVVHHLTYMNFGQEDIEKDLITVCQDCHNAIHGYKSVNRKKDKDRQTGRKILGLMLGDGTLKTYLFTGNISDNDIKKYVKHLEKKYKVQYKHTAIQKIVDENIIDTQKLKDLMSLK